MCKKVNLQDVTTDLTMYSCYSEEIKDYLSVRSLLSLDIDQLAIIIRGTEGVGSLGIWKPS